jgi:PST family polysaccharide transporter
MAKTLVGLGVAMMSAGLLAAIVAYFTRIIIVRQLGMISTGRYQAACTLSSYYVGFILGAMGTDFYPRLSGVSNDNDKSNRLMNDQVEIGLLLATPGITATLVLAPWVLQTFYSKEFVAAAAIVQWQVIGVFFRMISWPLWHLQIAKGLGKLFVISETASAVLQIILNWICITKWGLEGLGIGYLLFFVAHTIGMYFLCRRLSKFLWSRRFFQISVPGALLLAFTLAAVKLLPIVWGASLGLGFCLLACMASLYGLQKVLGVNVKTMIFMRFASKPE